MSDKAIVEQAVNHENDHDRAKQCRRSTVQDEAQQKRREFEERVRVRNEESRIASEKEREREALRTSFTDEELRMLEEKLEPDHDPQADCECSDCKYHRHQQDVFGRVMRLLRDR